VQENVPEDLGVKREMFAKLDAASEKNAVLASSSSGILPSRISAELASKSRCLVAHPINPPYLVPAVELVPAPWTDPQVVERTRQRLAELGQVLRTAEICTSTSFACCKAPKRIANGSPRRSIFHQGRKPPNGS